MENKRTFVRKKVIKVVQSIHGDKCFQPFIDNNYPKTNIIDFSGHLNSFGSILDYSDEEININNLIEESKADLKTYPDNRYLEFRHAAAVFLNNELNFENIVPGSDICELIKLIFGCCLNPGDKIIISYPLPAYYSHYAMMFGAKIVHLPPHQLLTIEDNVLSSAKLVIFSNPNCITGRLVSKKNLLKFANRCADNGTLLIVNEAGIELADPKQTLAGVINNNGHLIIIRSIGDVFAIPGIKIAYVVTSKNLATVLNTTRLPWSIDSFANIIGTSILKFKDGTECKYLRESKLFIEKQRNYLINGIKRIHGFCPVSSDTNFFIVDMSDLFLDATTLVKNLAAKGYLVKDCSHLYQEEKEILRINVRTKKDNENLLKTIGDVLSETSQENARIKLEISLESGSKNICTSSSRGTCQYYPCHFNGQDCTFCFCPFYPCKEENTGGKWITGAGGNQVWSCENCTYIHQPKLAHQMLDLLMEEGDTEHNLEKAWKKLIIPLL